MKGEEKVTSLELSRKLKDAGMRQRQSESFYDRDGRLWHAWQQRSRPKSYSDAPDCAELLEMFKRRVVLQKTHESVRPYHAFDHEHDYADMWDNTPAETLGKLLLWALEQGHVEEAPE